MPPSARRSKMVSFRLSPDEYRTFQEACRGHGVETISALARTALRKLVMAEERATKLSDEVLELKNRVRIISLELERVSRCFEGRQE